MVTDLHIFYVIEQGFPHSSVGKESACNAGHPSSIPRLGKSTREGLAQTPCPEGLPQALVRAPLLDLVLRKTDMY